MSKASKIWYGIAASLAVTQIAASALVPRGLALTAITDAVQSLIMLVVLVAFARNAATSQGRLRSFWILLAFSWAFRVTDHCLWFWYDVVLRESVPQIFFGDIIAFMAGVPTLAGLLLRPFVLPSKQSSRMGMIDFLQLMLCWVFVYVFLVMSWQYVTVDATLYSQNYDRLYQLQSLLLVGSLAVVIKSSTAAWRRFFSWFLAAVLFNCFSVLAENRAIDAGNYYSGCWNDVPFVLSLAFFMVVAVKGNALASVPQSVETKNYGVWLERLAFISVLSLPVAIIAMVAGYGPASGTAAEVIRFRVIITALTVFLLSALLFVKQRLLYSELRRTNQTLEDVSMTDPLTGVRNRRFFSSMIQSDVSRTVRAYEEAMHIEGKSPNNGDLVFYLIDMDDFKEVNDLYGHDAGDRVLIETVRRINSAIRESDLLIRWGGEEFLVVSRNADRKQADLLALRILRAVKRQPFAVGPTQESHRTCSIGWAAFPWVEDNLDSLGYEEVLNMADRALSQAKRAGKDQAISMTARQKTPTPTPRLKPTRTLVSTSA